MHWALWPLLAVLVLAAAHDAALENDTLDPVHHEEHQELEIPEKLHKSTRSVDEEGKDEVKPECDCAKERSKRNADYPRRSRQVHQYEVYEESEDVEVPAAAPYEEMLAASADHYHRVYAEPGSPVPARYIAPDSIKESADDHYIHKGNKGHKVTENHRKEYEDAEGKKRKHHDQAHHEGSHNEEAHGHKGSKFDEKKGHKKGHKTKGYHNKYHKDEFHKEHKFYDDFHKSGEHHRYGKFNAKHVSNESGKKKAHHVNAGHDFVERGKKGHSNKGHSDSDHKGHKSQHGQEAHHEKHGEYGHKGGKESAKHWKHEAKH